MKNEWPKNFLDLFWSEYPRHVGKHAAKKALETIRKKGAVDFDLLLGAVRVYANAVRGTNMQFVAHASTWLNQERWDDDPQHITGRDRSIAGAFDELVAGRNRSEPLDLGDPISITRFRH